MTGKFTNFDRFLYAPGTKMVFNPALYFIIISFLLILSIRMGMSKISAQKSAISQLSATYNTLVEKDTVLKASQYDILNAYSRPASLALPSKNPSLVEMVQIKNLASAYLLPLDELKISPSDSGSDKSASVKVSFKVAGDINQVISFIKALAGIAPATVVEKIEFSSSDNLVLASVSVSSYWAKIPGKLPNFSDPIEKLAEDDMAALEIMSQLTPPAFSDLVPSGPSARTNPFD
jgi:hypothetical protein